MDRFALRRDKLRQQLKSRELAAMLVTNFTNVTYLTGFSGDDSYLLVHPKGDVIISDPRYETQISEECPGLEAYIRPTSIAITSALDKVVAASDIQEKVLAVEADSMTLSVRDKVSEKLSKWEVRGVSGLVEALRTIKDKYEIDSIRKAIKSAKRAFELLRSGLTPNQTEIELCNDLEYFMRKFGAEDKGFNTIVGVGERAALPHAVPTAKKVCESELMLVDWGAKCDGYVSDLTRTLVTTPKPTQRFRKAYETVLTAQKKAIEAIKPGIAASEIDSIARKSIESAGMGRNFTHNLGHGLGLEVHESGRFSQSSDLILKPGMIMTVEPGVYFSGWGGIRIEDDVLVTKTGCEVLSSDVSKEFDDMFVQF